MSPTGTVPLERRIESDLQDVYFDYDKSDVSGEGRDALTRDAAALKAILTEFPTASIVVEGHCDERGSAEYNLGLGDRRASAAKDFLVQLGVPGDRLKTISYGKERPQCGESSEACWQKNRRAHFSPGQ
jgi:peptidoglycan-associated lipoprotein